MQVKQLVWKGFIAILERPKSWPLGLSSGPPSELEERAIEAVGGMKTREERT